LEDSQEYLQRLQHLLGKRLRNRNAAATHVYRHFLSALPLFGVKGKDGVRPDINLILSGEINTMNAIEVAQSNFNSWNRHDADAINAAYAEVVPTWIVVRQGDTWRSGGIPANLLEIA
jgi:hypothetical protein